MKINFTRISGDTPAVAINRGIYSLTDIAKVRGSLLIEFTGGSIYEQDCPVLVVYCEVARFFSDILSGDGKHRMNVFFEPAAFAVRQCEDVIICRFDPNSIDPSSINSFLEKSDTNKIALALESVREQKKRVFSDYDEDIFKYLSVS